jgi:Uma2 family endonuclease
MQATSDLVMTWEAFERLPDSDGFHRELLEGKLQMLPLPKFGQSQIASNVLELLLPIDRGELGRAFIEAGYKLSENPPTWIQPDASVLSVDRAKATAEDEHFLAAPEIAVEIISPSESAVDVEQKVTLLLAAGCQTLWVIYPKTQTVHVFVPGGQATICGINDMLPALPFGPAKQIPVASLFGN